MSRSREIALERSNRQGDYFGTIGALGHLAVLLAAMGAHDAALLLGVWSENNQANLDTSHPLFAGLSDQYNALMPDQPASEREELVRRVATMGGNEVLAVIRQQLEGLIPES